MTTLEAGTVWDRSLARAVALRPLRVAAWVLMAPFVLIGLVAAVVWFVAVAGVIAGVAEGWSTARGRLEGGDDVGG